jgi:hypothetical protein
MSPQKIMVYVNQEPYNQFYPAHADFIVKQSKSIRHYT